MQEKSNTYTGYLSRRREWQSRMKCYRGRSHDVANVLSTKFVRLEEVFATFCVW